MYICNKKDTCDETICGGKVPHGKCSECGKCPRDPDAICIEVNVANFCSCMDEEDDCPYCKRMRNANDT